MRKDSPVAGSLAYGLPLAASNSAESVAGHLVVVPAQLAYLSLPAESIRGFVDGFLPKLAKCEWADAVSGRGHRFRLGHDLMLDVPQTLAERGPVDALHHAGHIGLTDFPTRDGIPIPGFSQTGLGGLLTEVGIPSGWLQLNLFDAGIGVLAVSDGADNLTQALSGALEMTPETAFETFGAGSVDLALAIWTQNPLLAAGGIENLFAGLVSTWQTYTVYVDPLDFFGGSALSTLLGFAIAVGLAKQPLNEAAVNAVRSGMVGGLFSVSPAFGFGVLAGFAVFRLAGAMAAKHERDARSRLFVDPGAYEMLVEEICRGNDAVVHLINRALMPEPFSREAAVLPADGQVLSESPSVLSTGFEPFKGSPATLSEEAPRLKCEVKALPDDPPELTALYREAAHLQLQDR